MTRSTLVVVTQSHPYGSYVDFLEDEIRHLAAAFEQVILAPLAARGERQDVPPNVEVDLSLSNRLRSRPHRISAGLRRPTGLRLVGSELRRSRAPRRHPASVAHLLTAAGTAAEVERWCAARRLPPSTVALTVWLGAAAVGTSAAGIPTISRAHRGDLYEDHAPHGYLPLQRRAIEACEMVAAVSDAGAAHLRRRYPSHTDRIGVRRLGITGTSRVGTASSDGVLRVVSCSSLVPVKRPELLVETVRALADRKAEVEWHHFGSGPLHAAFEERVRGTLGGAHVVLHGAVANQAVLDHYESQPVDVLLNTSSSEGLPVSMMEAASAGIPIVAPDVGGIGEIVDEDSGRLYPRDADPRSIAEAIVAVVEADGTARRDAIRQRWRERYSANVNYPAFAHELAELAARKAR